jgi:hypothetical protein
MRYFTFFLILFTTISCTKKVKVQKKNGIYTVSEINVELEGFKHIEWEVGQEREVDISQGIILRISVPHMKEKDIKALAKRYGVDGWIYKIVKINKGRRSIIGYVELPFRKVNKTTDNFSAHILYAAAAPSIRFRRFRCPAFNHRKKITGLDMETKNKDKLSLFLSVSDPIRSRIDNLDQMPLIFSGGMSLIGSYHVELALYNRSEKQVHGRFTRLPGTVFITREVEMKVSSCFGIKEEVKPLPGSREPRIQDLEIK